MAYRVNLIIEKYLNDLLLNSNGVDWAMDSAKVEESQLPKTLILLNLKSLPLLEKNPELITKVLSQIEFEIVDVLARSLHGLSIRAIQRKIIENRLISSTTYKSAEENMRMRIHNQTIEELLTYVKEKKIEAPSHNTIGNNLDHLCEEGYVGRRMLSEKRKISFIYFINPAVYDLIKKSEGK